MYTQDDLKKLSDEDKKRKKHSVEMDMVILESDLKKITSRKTELESEIRKLKYDEERIRINLEEKNKELNGVTLEITQGEDDIKRLKKQLNLLV